jgi:NADPH:quinone reductase-like Zn-dependent oxidoreductase
VYGLLPLHHSGALAEFITVDRRRLYHAPSPHEYFTLEQIALLPLAGIPAHRGAHTLGTDETRRRPRALVLNAHDGAGALATQELTLRGADVVAQVPPRAWQDSGEGERCVERARLFGAMDVIENEPLQAKLSRVGVRLRP